MEKCPKRGYKIVSAFVNFAYQSISDFFFPQYCLNCGILLNTYNNKYICNECRPTAFNRPTGIICFKCGKELANKNLANQIPENLIRCRNCAKHEPDFDFCRHIFVYENHIKTLIRKFKYESDDELSVFFARELVGYLTNQNNIFNSFVFDCITNIPMHRDRLKSREFDHIDLLCVETAKLCNCRYIKNLLLKTKNTNQQANLKRIERLNNVRNSFTINPGFAQNLGTLKNILLIDDVYSTGATINECSRELKKHNRQLTIYGITIARGI